MVNDFYSSRYASCLSHLVKMQSSLRLDVHLQKHAAELTAAVSISILLSLSGHIVWPAKHPSVSIQCF